MSSDVDAAASTPVAGAPASAQALGSKRRYLLGGIGGALVVCGAIAVFRTDNEAGTLALLLAGAGFLVLAVTGILPRRLTVGSNTVEYGELAGEVVTSALKSEEPGVREEVAKLVIDAAEGRDAGGDAGGRRAADLTREARAALIAEETLEAVRANLPDGCVVHPSLGRSDRHLAFGHPDEPPSRTVLVTVMWGSLRRPWLVNYLRAARGTLHGAFVFIGPGNDLPVVASESPPLFAVGWTGGLDDYKLKPVLSTALRAAETGEIRAPEIRGM